MSAAGFSKGPPLSLRLREQLHGVLYAGNKKDVPAAIALADKIMQRLAGVTGVVADDGDLQPVIHELLQNLARKSAAEDEEGLRERGLVEDQPFAAVSYFALMAASSAALASAIGSPGTTCAMLCSAPKISVFMD